MESGDTEGVIVYCGLLAGCFVRSRRSLGCSYTVLLYYWTSVDVDVLCGSFWSLITLGTC